jgi:hypothetical protein
VSLDSVVENKTLQRSTQHGITAALPGGINPGLPVATEEGIFCDLCGGGSI